MQLHYSMQILGVKQLFLLRSCNYCTNVMSFLVDVIDQHAIMGAQDEELPMTGRMFTQAEVDELIAQAVAAEREACVLLVLSEPELEGDMPAHLRGLGEEYLARLAVKATKRNVIQALRARG
jgi:hypothetical protein